MSRVLARLKGRLPNHLRRRIAVADGRIKADSAGIDPGDAEAISVVLTEDPFGSDQFVEVQDQGQDLGALHAAIEARGLPIRGLQRSDDEQGVIVITCGRGADDATEEELDQIRAAARERNLSRPRELVKEELERVLGRIQRLQQEPTIYARELTELATKRAALVAEIDGIVGIAAPPRRLRK